MTVGSQRTEVDPAMQAWIDEQKKKFKPSDLDRLVALMRGWDRAERANAQRGSAAA